MGYLILFFALAFTALGQLFYKLFVARGRAAPHIVMAMAFFVFAQVGYFMALTQLELGVVYMSTGLVHVCVLVLSALVLQEAVNINHIIAVLLICAGLLLYAG